MWIPKKPVAPVRNRLPISVAQGIVSVLTLQWRRLACTLRKVTRQKYLMRMLILRKQTGQFCSDSIFNFLFHVWYCCIKSTDILASCLILPHHHSRLQYCFHTAYAVFNLSQLDSQTADFYLKIIASYIDNVSVLSPICKVPCPVQFPIAKRIVDKLFRCQFRAEWKSSISCKW